MEHAIVELGAGHLHVIGELTPSLCFMPGHRRTVIHQIKQDSFKNGTSCNANLCPPIVVPRSNQAGRKTARRVR